MRKWIAAAVVVAVLLGGAGLLGWRAGQAGVKAHRVEHRMRYKTFDALLVLGCLTKPRYWYQIPWRFVCLFNNGAGRKMREKVLNKRRNR